MSCPHLSKFVCDNMPGFLATFRSRNLLFCLELSLSPPKARHMRAVLPVFFKLTAHDSLIPLTLTRSTT